jgi:hypothetical protein
MVSIEPARESLLGERSSKHAGQRKQVQHGASIQGIDVITDLI